MRKTILGTILLLVIGGGFIYYSSQHPEPLTTQQAENKVHSISLFHYFSGSLSGGLAEMVEKVNQNDPTHRVQAQALDHEAFKTMIHSTLEKGNPPELFSYWAGAKTQKLVNQGKLEPLDDIWESIPLSERFNSPVTEAASSYNGKKYLLPITQHYVTFFYNAKLFRQEGLAPPATWDELRNIAETLQSRNIIPFALGAKERWPAQFWFDYLLLRTAGPDYRKHLMQGKARYIDPEVQKVYSLWGELLGKGYFNSTANELDWDEATRLLCTDKAAMTLMGTWVIQLFTGQECNLSEESGFDFFTFPILNNNVERVALGPVDGLVLTRNSTDADFAKTVLTYFSEPTPQKILSAGSGAFAPSSEISRNFYSPLRYRILQESEKASKWAFNYDLATDIDIAEKGMDSFSELIAFPDQATEILRNLQKEVEKLLPAQ